MTTPNHDATLEKVRKLLTKAEAEGVTPAEAETYTAKAAELMAKYGIDRALLASTRPETDKPADRKIDCENPWGRVKAHLLAGLAAAMRCQCVMLPSSGPYTRIHVFGYQSDLERLDVMYTSLLLQMTSALNHDIKAVVASINASGPRLKAWRRSYLLGFAATVVQRVKDAEQYAESAATHPSSGTSSSTALVLADRSLVVKNLLTQAYPKTRKARITYTGNGYGHGQEAGRNANIGGTGLGRRSAGALH